MKKDRTMPSRASGTVIRFASRDVLADRYEELCRLRAEVQRLSDNSQPHITAARDGKVDRSVNRATQVLRED